MLGVFETHCAAALSDDLVSDKYPQDESRDMALTLSDCSSPTGADERECYYRRRKVGNVFQ